MAELAPEAYSELRIIAHRVVRSKGSLTPTVVLHEAWMKLDRSRMSFESREHFYAVAAKAMRQIASNHARDRAAQKRGGGAQRTTLEGVGGMDRALDVLELESCLDELEAAAPDAARVVELRVFGGLSLAETATALGTSERSVSRSWRFARAFLESRLRPDV